MYLTNDSGPRVLVAGDSWVRGLTRSGKGSVGALLPVALGASDVLDVSAISRTVPETVSGYLTEIERFRPDVAMLAIGGADSLVFPVQWFQRLIDRYAPPKWSGVAGLMPPAMLPRDRRKRIRKKIEIFGKTVIKQVMINLFGARRRVPLAEVETAARELLDTLARLGTVVVVIGCCDVDQLTFPKSCESIHATNAAIARLTTDYPNAMYVRTNLAVHKWNDYLEDRVHLTREGNRKAADTILAAMLAAGDPWAAQLVADEVIPTAVAG